MGLDLEHRTIAARRSTVAQHQSGLKRRYLALLVPALAKARAANETLHGSEILHGSPAHVARARVVRRAADTCLIQAMLMSRQSAESLHPQRWRARTCRRGPSSLFRRLFRRATARSVRPQRQRRSSTARAATAAATRPPRRYEDSPCVDLDEDELQRLREVMSYPALADGENEAPGDCVCPHAASRNDHGATQTNDNDPAADLLSQAAHYIMALQVQIQVLGVSFLGNKMPSILALMRPTCALLLKFILKVSNDFEKVCIKIMATIEYSKLNP